MERRRELDSLRGLAALSVLAYHALALNSANLTAGLALEPVDGFAAGVAVYSPLHVAWLGGESVWLFFVLSGFVLTISAGRENFDWARYYPSRMVRLYLPVVFAIGLAWLTYLIPHNLTPQMDQHLPVSYVPTEMLFDALLIGGTSNGLGVLWSLQWEVIFSLLLPVYVVLARRRPIVSAIAAGLVLVAGWYLRVLPAEFMPMFLVGVLLATYWNRFVPVARFFERGAWRHVVAAALLIVSWCALTSYFLIGPWLADAGIPTRPVTVPLALAGIAAIVVLVQTWPPLRRVLTTRPLVFLGTISFSLYLVHLPFVVQFVFVLPAGLANALASMAVSLVVAVAFYFGIERRAHRLARRVARSDALDPVASPAASR